MQLLNILACSILFGLSSWAILSPNFRDGLLMKKALILIAMTSFAGIVHSGEPQFSPTFDAVALNVSFAALALTVALRRFTRPVWSRHDRKPQPR